MTERQKFGFYFPLWRRACEANGWRMEKGVCGICEEGLSEVGRQVVTLGRQRAVARGAKGLALDDLRHGAHMAALGRDKSSEHLTNGELDRVAAVMKLLVDETDLDASMERDNPEIGMRRRTVGFIKGAAPHAYIDAICRGKFRGTYEAPFWEDLPMWALRQLAVTLKERGRKWREPVKNAECRMENAEADPF